jgi:hypothetical protein
MAKPIHAQAFDRSAGSRQARLMPGGTLPRYRLKLSSKWEHRSK